MKNRDLVCVGLYEDDTGGRKIENNTYVCVEFVSICVRSSVVGAMARNIYSLRIFFELCRVSTFHAHYCSCYQESEARLKGCTVVWYVVDTLRSGFIFGWYFSSRQEQSESTRVIAMCEW